jgi:hypothetical protein
MHKRPVQQFRLDSNLQRLQQAIGPGSVTHPQTSSRAMGSPLTARQDGVMTWRLL